MLLGDVFNKKMTEGEKEKYLYDIYIIETFVDEYLGGVYLGRYCKDQEDNERILDEEILSATAFQMIVGYYMVMDVPMRNGRTIKIERYVKGILETLDPDEYHDIPQLDVPFDFNSIKGMLQYISEVYSYKYDEKVKKFPNDSGKFYFLYAIAAAAEILINEIDEHDKRADWFAQ